MKKAHVLAVHEQGFRRSKYQPKQTIASGRRKVNRKDRKSLFLFLAFSGHTVS